MVMVMVLAPRIMRGELDKLPKRQLPDGSVGKRTPNDLAKLQSRLADEQGMGIDILCDFLHDIPGFTRAATRDHGMRHDGGKYDTCRICLR
jgi:hypothetical protein